MAEDLIPAEEESIQSSPPPESDGKQEELREFVLRALETEGVLGHIRAQLRSAVHKAIDCDDEAQTLLPHGPLQSSTAACSTAKQQFLRSRTGRLLAEIVAECFEFYGFKHSLSVFMPESGLGAGRSKREEPGLLLRDRKDVACEAGLDRLLSGTSVLEQLVAVAHGQEGQPGGVPLSRSATATSGGSPPSSPSNHDSVVGLGDFMTPSSPTTVDSEPIVTPVPSLPEDTRPTPYRVLGKLPPLTTGNGKEMKKGAGAMGIPGLAAPGGSSSGAGVTLDDHHLEGSSPIGSPRMRGMDPAERRSEARPAKSHVRRREAPASSSEAAAGLEERLLRGIHSLRGTTSGRQKVTSKFQLLGQPRPPAAQDLAETKPQQSAAPPSQSSAESLSQSSAEGADLSGTSGLDMPATDVASPSPKPSHQAPKPQSATVDPKEGEEEEEIVEEIIEEVLEGESQDEVGGHSSQDSSQSPSATRSADAKEKRRAAERDMAVRMPKLDLKAEEMRPATRFRELPAASAHHAMVSLGPASVPQLSDPVHKRGGGLGDLEHRPRILDQLKLEPLRDAPRKEVPSLPKPAEELQEQSEDELVMEASRSRGSSKDSTVSAAVDVCVEDVFELERLSDHVEVVVRSSSEKELAVGEPLAAEEETPS
mmetsp:Transcript_31996/g.74989  ORF Transcript_31996/g.74989 Transcript_31996/m.74989 type:complete len:650 (+) Transcript_31996:88-2037(+)